MSSVREWANQGKDHNKEGGKEVYPCAGGETRLGSLTS